MSTMDNTQVLLARRPHGKPQPEDFALRTVAVPELDAGQALLRNHFVSLDAGFRNWMDEGAGDDVLPAMELGAPVMGLVMGEVISSRHSDYVVGDWLMARIAWEEYSVADDSRFIVKIDPSEPYPMNYYLGVLGDTGLSAYFGMVDIGKPQPGETVLVSAAGGAVGSIAGQIARICGARAVGIVGTKAKADRLVAELDYDDVIVHTGNLDEQLRATCPEGVDVYFDNVGGPILEKVLDHLAVGARIALCGAVSTYGNPSSGPGNLFQLVTKEALMQGFFAHTQVDRYPSARRQLAHWIDAGRLLAPEYMLEGIANVAPGFCDLFAGRNFGKTLVKL